MCSEKREEKAPLAKSYSKKEKKTIISIEWERRRREGGRKEGTYCLSIDIIDFLSCIAKKSLSILYLFKT